jgi:hypothetical protein
LTAPVGFEDGVDLLVEEADAHIDLKHELIETGDDLSRISVTLTDPSPSRRRGRAMREESPMPNPSESHISGEATARKIQLQIEYDPAPPFVGGTPMTSPPEITAALRDAARERCAKRELMVAEAAARL